MFETVHCNKYHPKWCNWRAVALARASGAVISSRAVDGAANDTDAYTSADYGDLRSVHTIYASALQQKSSKMVQRSSQGGARSEPPLTSRVHQIFPTGRRHLLPSTRCLACTRVSIHNQHSAYYGWTHNWHTSHRAAAAEPAARCGTLRSTQAAGIDDRHATSARCAVPGLECPAA